MGYDQVLEAAASADGSNGGTSSVEDLPVATFSLLIGLNPNQEASLFRDINGEHKGMDVTHLAAIQVRISDPDELKHSPKLLPLWIADQLANPGRAFENMVFYGGESKGLKGLGEQRPVKLNSLKTTIGQQLKSAEKVSTFLGDDPDTLLGVLDNFWKAVRSTFPEAWGDKSNYILLQAIGLGAFAKYGASVIDTAYDAEAVSQEDFANYLAPVKSKVSLRREDYPGIAGAGGAQYVAELLLKASEPDLVKAETIKGFFKGAETVDELLGLHGETGGLLKNPIRRWLLSSRSTPFPSTGSPLAQRSLTAPQAQRLMALLSERLRDSELEAPLPGEREPAFTARCLLGIVRASLSDLRIHGLVEGGDGGSRARPVSLCGLLFYPDLTVRYHGEPVLAFEVKYLGRAGRQSSMATGLGQAYLYRQVGYKHAGAFLIDLANRITDDEIKGAEEICRSGDIEVIIRRKIRRLLVEHPR